MEIRENAKFHGTPSACKVCLHICGHTLVLCGVQALACLLYTQSGVRLFFVHFEVKGIIIKYFMKKFELNITFVR